MIDSNKYRLYKNRKKAQIRYVLKQYALRYGLTLLTFFVSYVISNSMLVGTLLSVGVWLITTMLFDHRDAVLFSPTIRIWFGVPGSGKTSMAAYIAKFVTKQGYRVLSNVPVKGTYKVEDTDLGRYDMSFDGDGCSVILDEAMCNGLYNRMFKEFAKSTKPKYFSLHRHMKNRVDVFSQGYDIDLNVKDRCGSRGMFHLQKTPIKGFVMYRRIQKIFFIKKDDKQFLDGFKYIGLPRFAYTRQVWDSFDTDDMSLCPTEQKEWKLWED